MSLITRCPTCGTAFRVQPAQLVARSGRVRCGKCSAVFDAVSCLVGEQGAPLTVEPSPQLGLFDPSRRSAAADTTLNLDLSTAAPAASRPPPATARPPAASPSRPPSTPLPSRPSASQPPASPSSPRLPSPSRIRREEPEEVPEFLEDDAPAQRFTILWGMLALLAFAGLAGQLALYFRNELALVLPAVRPQLAAACDVIGCTLRLPHRSDLMSIDSSDLQAEPGRDNVIVLNALIRNRAGFAQEYPALELTLTDEIDQPVVRRVLTPLDYLGPTRAQQLIARGMSPGSELSVRMRFDAGSVRATGFRLFLFFP
jgi:predicted Zn finger-like uncharacterized protein